MSILCVIHCLIHFCIVELQVWYLLQIPELLWKARCTSISTCCLCWSVLFFEGFKGNGSVWLFVLVDDTVIGFGGSAWLLKPAECNCWEIFSLPAKLMISSAWALQQRYKQMRILAKHISKIFPANNTWSFRIIPVFKQHRTHSPSRYKIWSWAGYWKVCQRKLCKQICSDQEQQSKHKVDLIYRSLKRNSRAKSEF